MVIQVVDCPEQSSGVLAGHAKEGVAEIADYVAELTCLVVMVNARAVHRAAANRAGPTASGKGVRRDTLDSVGATTIRAQTLVAHLEALVRAFTAATSAAALPAFRAHR